MTFRADLHVHSTFSDGTFTPEEIFKEAKKIGLAALSVTDHDTINAYKEAVEAARKYEISLIPGVEISTVHAGVGVHILGYGFPINSAPIVEMCQEHCVKREIRNRRILELLEKAGMPVLEEELVALSHSEGSVGRPHIARAMMQHGYVSSIQEAFTKYLGEEKPCYFPDEKISTKEGIERIQEGGGLAVLAHPHLLQKSSIVDDLLNLPFDGIEVYYGRFPLSVQEKWLSIALEKDFMVTGGSDFHGTVKPSMPLGRSWIGEDHMNSLVKACQVVYS